MEIGFDTTDVLLLHRIGKPCLLPGDGFSWWWKTHHFRYRSNEQREAYSDGLSSPQFTHCSELLEPYGDFLPAAVAHDGGYHDGVEIETPEGWKPFHLSKDDCDRMLYDLTLVLAGGDEEKQKVALLIYEAVHLGGKSSYDEGHAKAIAV